MKAISIQLASDTIQYIDETPYYTGRMSIGTYDEFFELSVKYWSLKDYIKQ